MVLCERKLLMALLGVNIDHVATLRQARREFDPDPIYAAQVCVKAGAHSIVAHLREDRRHIQDQDVFMLRKALSVRFNLEMSLAPSIVQQALLVKPHQATLVPERRQEITTEGGLDVVGQLTRTKGVVEKLKTSGIEVSLFIAPLRNQIDASIKTGATMIELHTGSYAQAYAQRSYQKQLQQIKQAVKYAQSKGLVVHLGHGINYENAFPLREIKGIGEYNIGHAIISKAVFVGLAKAVKEMVGIIKA
jgi:pyridoxine 5-phosphate synthase